MVAPVSVSFSQEIRNLLYAAEGTPVDACMQCGTCSGTCPAVEFMSHSPREIIALIRADARADVLSSPTIWCCASCYQCTVRCPRGIDIAGLMYALKRYSMWKKQYPEDAIGPVFSETFVKTIFRAGRSYEPVLATAYVFTYGVPEMLQEAYTATSLMLKGRIPLVPPRIKRLENFKRMIGKIIPVGES